MRGELCRRELVGLAATLLARPAWSEPAPVTESRPAKVEFEVMDLELQGSPDLARRARVIFPKELAESGPLYTLVLLHGLGETGDENAGVHAWVERYGLLSSYARLWTPPLWAGTRGDLTGERAEAINRDLARKPFRGRMAFVCPYTPNVWHLPNLKTGIDRYADWIADTLLTAVHAQVPATRGFVAIDGCSLGGFVALEVFLRKPHVFGAWGGVQSAFNQGSAAGAAERIASAATHGTRHLHIETSKRDPFYAANIALSLELDKKKIAHELTVLPGPHDQPWLREAGTLEMLLWHDRVLG
jgi:hypothetical protein